MGDIINISNTKDKLFLEYFKRLENVIPESMDETSVNPLIQYIREKGSVSKSLIDFFNHSDFLELLTKESLAVSIELYNLQACTEWFEIMCCIMEEKSSPEEYCKMLPICLKAGMNCEEVNDLIMNSNDPEQLATLIRQRQESRELEEEGCSDENMKAESGDSVPGCESAKEAEGYQELCKQQKAFIEQLLLQKAALEDKNSEFIAIIQQQINNKKDMDKKLLELQCINNKLFSEKTDLEKQVREYLQNMDAVCGKMAQHKKEIFQYMREREQIRQEISDIDQLKEQNDELRKQKESMEKINCETKDFAKQLEDKVAVLQTEKEQLQVSLEESKNSILRLNESIDLKNSELADLHEKVKELEMMSSLTEKKHFVPEDANEVVFRDKIEEPVNEPMVDETDMFPQSEVITIDSGKENVKKKCHWFSDLFVRHSKKAFLKNSRQDQESMIFIKMMEMHYSLDKVQKVKKSMTENVPCFDLYKLICKDPSLEELDDFFSEYEVADEVYEVADEVYEVADVV